MIKVLELFGGIGACSKALERLGIEYEIADYVEIDKYAVKSFNAIHNTNFEPQDICQWDKDIEVDLIMHGSPCQDFSIAGNQAGGDEGSGTRSSLMYETIRIVEKLKPKYVVWENVKNLLSDKHRHNFDAYLETMSGLGYKSYYQVLNAKDYGIPQNRERVFTVSIRNDIEKVFEFPPKQDLKLRLKDMLEDEVDEKYYLPDEIITKFIPCNSGNVVGHLDIKGHDCIKRVYATEKCSPTLTDMQGGNRQPKILLNNQCVQVGNLNRQGYHEFSNRVYSTDGIARTLMGSGGNNNDRAGQYLIKPTIQKVDIPQLVKVRKYVVDIERLKELLRTSRTISISDISEKLNKPKTLVEHWFRKDNCFAIPDADIWYELKTLLNIKTDEFDKAITEFEEREGVFEKSNRCYFDSGIAPTITSASADEKIIVSDRDE